MNKNATTPSRPFGYLSVLREAGFFRDYASLSDEALLDEILKKRKDAYFDLFNENASEIPSTDHALITLDTKKVLYLDMEADVCAGNNSYTDLLLLCNRISGKEDLITDIREVWESDSGPINVNCKIDGQEKTFAPAYQDDWYDDMILGDVLVEIAAATKEPYYACLGPDYTWAGQDVVIIRLTTEEKKILEEKLQLVLEPFTSAE
ncbi:hypothetical protein [Chitinophaga sp. HK235]|uniref:hypothetical protein n=1 Tax=Chitinophaga sp. HK235 TaxID=2952571 RepID=UPI001BA91B19|nr:hypothetical protein [Chitinophaga sp. HK235]